MHYVGKINERAPPEGAETPGARTTRTEGNADVLEEKKERSVLWMKSDGESLRFSAVFRRLRLVRNQEGDSLIKENGRTTLTRVTLEIGGAAILERLR